jgi:uncharacterized membrane protein YidH (DUF202 family)
VIPPDADLQDEMLEEDEEGLAAERTDLAWGRSGLAVMGCGVAILRGLPALDAHPAQPVAGAVILMMGGVVWMIGLYAARKRRTEVGEWRPAAQLAELGPIGLGTAAVGLAGAVLVMFQDT